MIGLSKFTSKLQHEFLGTSKSLIYSSLNSNCLLAKIKNISLQQGISRLCEINLKHNKSAKSQVNAFLIKCAFAYVGVKGDGEEEE